MSPWLIFTLIAWLPGWALADAPPLAADHPEQYRVQAGDTLWSIAERFLKDPWRWQELWHDNPDIQQPHRIYPGDLLVLHAADAIATVEAAPQLVVAATGPREIKLTPQVRREVLRQAVPTIPLDAIQQFLTRPRVMSQADLDALPRVLSFMSEHLIGGAGDTLYVSAVEEDTTPKFDLVRPGQIYRDPDTQEPLGYEALLVGSAKLLRAGKPAKLLLINTQREVQIDDRLLPEPEETVWTNFQPRPGPPFLDGAIIAVLNGVSQIGQFNVVALNRGTNDGLEPGHVLEILQRAQPPQGLRENRWQRPVELPLETAGVLMVFRVFDQVSYALIMRATAALHISDRVRTPE